jgi:hypothetical protein
MAALKQSDLRPKIWLRFVNVHHMAMWWILSVLIRGPPKCNIWTPAAKS